MKSSGAEGEAPWSMALKAANVGVVWWGNMDVPTMWGMDVEPVLDVDVNAWAIWQTANRQDQTRLDQTAL